ncbi:MAG: WecB/TagA/CpsF family glycosyltransferase [Streptosporangiales bacterium]
MKEGEGTHRAPRPTWWRAAFDDPAQREAVHTLIDTVGMPVLAWPHPTVNVLGINVSAVRKGELMADIEHALSTRLRLTMTYVDVPHLQAARRNSVLAARMNTFDQILADSGGVRLAGRLLGKLIPPRVTADEVAQPLFDLLARRGSRVFLLGAAPGEAADVAEQLGTRYPGLKVVGTMHGELDIEEGTPGRYSQAAFDQMVREVNAAEPDLLVVALPTPNPQRFVIDNLVRLKVPVIVTAENWIERLATPGAPTDQPPAWMSRLRLGWAYRLVRDPVGTTRYAAALVGLGLRALRQRWTVTRATRNR